VAAEQFRPVEILRALVEHGVEFVLIGGFAAQLQGSPFPTEDIDVTPARGLENLRRLSAALTSLDARIRTVGEEPLPFAHDAESLDVAGAWNLSTRYGDLDLSMVPSGTGGYPDLVRGAVLVTLEGVDAQMADLADIVRSKQAANRPKDQRVLPALRELLVMREERERR